MSRSKKSIFNQNVQIRKNQFSINISRSKKWILYRNLHVEKIKDLSMPPDRDGGSRSSIFENIDPWDPHPIKVAPCSQRRRFPPMSVCSPRTVGRRFDKDCTQSAKKITTIVKLCKLVGRQNRNSVTTATSNICLSKNPDDQVCFENVALPCCKLVTHRNVPGLHDFAFQIIEITLGFAATQFALSRWAGGGQWWRSHAMIGSNSDTGSFDTAYSCWIFFLIYQRNS